MATKKKTTESDTLSTIGESIKTAAQTVVEKAEEYVVDPIGQALGLTEEKKEPERKMTASEKKQARKAAVKRATAKPARRVKRAAV